MKREISPDQLKSLSGSARAALGTWLRSNGYGERASLSVPLDMVVLIEFLQSFRPKGYFSPPTLTIELFPDLGSRIELDFGEAAEDEDPSVFHEPEMIDGLWRAVGEALSK